MLRTMVLILFATVVQAPEPPAPVSMGTFAGTWVGLQTVKGDTLPGALEGQTVTLTIELVDGKFAGSLTPFFGGSDGATFSEVQIVGEELHAAGVVGRPASAGRGGRGATGWKADTRIQFVFKADRTHMTGTADVVMNGVPWMKYQYDLEKKRARY